MVPSNGMLQELISRMEMDSESIQTSPGAALTSPWCTPDLHIWYLLSPHCVRAQQLKARSIQRTPMTISSSIFTVPVPHISHANDKQSKQRKATGQSRSLLPALGARLTSS